MDFSSLIDALFKCKISVDEPTDEETAVLDTFLDAVLSDGTINNQLQLLTTFPNFRQTLGSLAIILAQRNLENSNFLFETFHKRLPQTTPSNDLGECII